MRETREPDTRQAGLERARRQGRGHRAGARDGRRAEGRQRPPRHGDEPGAGGVPALPEGDAAQPRRPALDRAATGSCSRCGHSSLTLYIQLFLGGWGLELEDLEALRTWGSKTPGHPEYGHTAGVEITTGPLGQGVGNAVGMAMAARREHGLLDPNAALGDSPFDHHIYALCSDGDIEEGVSAEASAIAGVQELGNLTVIYDDNRISIEDNTDIALTEDVARALRGLRLARAGRRLDPRRHEVRRGRAGAVRRHRKAAEAVTDKPSFIVLHTIIAWPAPNAQNTGKAHGSALGADEVAATKKVLGFDPEKTFEVAAERPRAHPRRPSSAARPRRPPGTTSTPPGRASPSADKATLRPAADPHPARRLGRRTCRRSTPTRRASRPASRRAT